MHVNKVTVARKDDGTVDRRIVSSGKKPCLCTNHYLRTTRVDLSQGVVGMDAIGRKDVGADGLDRRHRVAAAVPKMPKSASVGSRSPRSAALSYDERMRTR